MPYIRITSLHKEYLRKHSRRSAVNIREVGVRRRAMAIMPTPARPGPRPPLHNGSRQSVFTACFVFISYTFLQDTLEVSQFYQSDLRYAFGNILNLIRSFPSRERKKNNDYDKH